MRGGRKKSRFSFKVLRLLRTTALFRATSLSFAANVEGVSLSLASGDIRESLSDVENFSTYSDVGVNNVRVAVRENSTLSYSALRATGFTAACESPIFAVAERAFSRVTREKKAQYRNTVIMLPRQYYISRFPRTGLDLTAHWVYTIRIRDSSSIARSQVRVSQRLRVRKFSIVSTIIRLLADIVVPTR